ncbi:hypothetical protein [Spongiimicrobium sp. 2-473A-2-J]|uniref:hypothetical protein n=1 Tax=Eudoraea algarum TaxID=3417568 RepID=UPI003D361783
MSEYNKTKNELKAARETKHDAEKSIFLAGERLKKLKTEKEKLLRVFGPDHSRVKQIVTDEQALGTQIVNEKVLLDEHRNLEIGAIAKFDAFTDPRKHIGQFSDELPILLFPVRLETRFKRVEVDNNVFRNQLWVRIFPDECSVDTFENIPSEAEILKAKDYWMSVWSTGTSNEDELQDFIESGLKGAWRALANHFQAGRAYWIIQNYGPLAMEDLPVRVDKDEIILCIGVEELPVAAEQDALKAYWKKIWLAGDNLEDINQANADLIMAVSGEERAAELMASYVPFNLHDQKVPDENPPEVKVSFVQFPKTDEMDSKQSSWSQAASVRTLPEKFVLLGFQGKDDEGNPIKVLEELGGFIPDPLIIGPNPSLDSNDLLKQQLIADFGALTTDQARTLKLAEYYDNLKDRIRAEKTEAAFIAEFQALVDPEAVETWLGQVFEDFKDEIKAAQYIDYLSQRSETQWLFDFEEAVKVGMGFKIDLSREQYAQGFDRLFVMGVNLREDKTESQKSLETLFHNHHYGSSGFSIMPQGTPTNNTEKEDSGFTENEDTETTFERYIAQKQTDDPDDSLSKKDGRWLSDLLGIDPTASSLKLAAHYYHTDQCEARAMNTALWNATIGYFMESMMTPVFDTGQERLARDFFIDFISGRGSLPAIRIGDQPYGILAIGKTKKPEWLFDRTGNNLLANSKYGNSIALLQRLSGLLDTVRKDFIKLQEEVAYVGKEGDPHQNLLNVLGLHATSVQFDQRYAESFAHLFNKLNMSGLGIFIALLIEGAYKKRGLDLLKKLGYVPQTGDNEEDLVPILEKFFLTQPNTLNKPLIDDVPLSEEKPIRAYTTPEGTDTEGKNYIHWLVENAAVNLNTIKRQLGFADKAPTALLYQMLRHSLTLEFSNTSFNLYGEAGILSVKDLKEAKIDDDFIGVKVGQNGFESKFDYLERPEPRIVNEDITVAKHISNLIAENISLASTLDLKAMLKALDHLKDVPTARLERAFVEHLDCCSYRLDAWLLAFSNMQLTGMRYWRNAQDETVKEGIYLGAYGWVEDLKPDPEQLAPAQLPEELQPIFDPDDSRQIVTDSNNAGFIHAPSINQAITASVLRNAYITEASPEDPETYKVNLSSERVRMAMAVIEGMRQGQSLGALLGYQLERGLHDRYAEAEVDIFIYELRIAFPLRGNQLNETSQNEGDIESITQIEARNVVDGLALVEHVLETKNNAYPFGKDLRFANEPQFADHRKIVNEEVARLLNINDAVADLGIAESVHQVVQGNYDRAAGTMDAFSKGGFPPTPDVVRTPRSGISLTNRVGIHLETGITIADPLTTKARVVAEPAIDALLGELLPPMSEIHCQYSYRSPSYEGENTNPTTTASVSMQDLGLSPIDLLYLVDLDSQKNLTALDEYILKRVYETDTPRPDVEFQIHYTQTFVDRISLFELAPLLRNLRSLILASRPLRPSDIALPNEANEATDSSGFIPMDRIDDAFDKFKANFKDATDLDQGIDLASDPFLNHFDEEDFEVTMANKDAIIGAIDAYVDLFGQRMFSLSEFGIKQAGFGFIYDRKAAIYKAIYEKVFAYRKRWAEKITAYNQLINTDLIAPSLDEEGQLEVLKKAERLISTTYTVPLPPPPNAVAAYQAIVQGKRGEFDGKLAEIDAWLNGNFIAIKDLIGELNKLRTGVGSASGKSLTDFDLLTIDTDDAERQAIIFGEDLKLQAVALNEAVKETAKVAQAKIDEGNVEVLPSKKVKLLTQAMQLLLGEDFKIVPEFGLPAVQGAEIKKAYDDSDILLKYQKDTLGTDFPVDDWLYGVARVRERMGNWENTVMHSEAFKDTTLDLRPMQLPYKNEDVWLGLSFPESYVIEADKLLYTAYIKNLDPTKPVAGLLIDEWTEVIPTPTETTGLSFQYDQPNAEPPQSMLLVTPHTFKGQWQWQDVVDNLHDTLDMAKLRAIEPTQIDATPYAQFLPATVSAVTVHPFMTIAMNYALNNNITLKTVDNG